MIMMMGKCEENALFFDNVTCSRSTTQRHQVNTCLVWSLLLSARFPCSSSDSGVCGDWEGGRD
jgi:hypothetical protein